MISPRSPFPYEKGDKQSRDHYPLNPNKQMPLLKMLMQSPYNRFLDTIQMIRAEVAIEAAVECPSRNLVKLMAGSLAQPICDRKSSKTKLVSDSSGMSCVALQSFLKEFGYNTFKSPYC
jgi:hypothetical protein